MNSNPKVVCLGGGHGLAATLAAMRTLTNQVTAVVTVADNGGSSGRLRAEFNSHLVICVQHLLRSALMMNGAEVGHKLCSTDLQVRGRWIITQLVIYF